VNRLKSIGPAQECEFLKLTSWLYALVIFRKRDGDSVPERVYQVRAVVEVVVGPVVPVFVNDANFGGMGARDIGERGPGDVVLRQARVC